LYGQGGNDLLCGEAGVNELWGGEGVDLACTVDDEASATVGEEAGVDLAANDEDLNDTTDDTVAFYTLEDVPAGITALIDQVTGFLTFSGDTPGDYVLTYAINRPTDDIGNLLSYPADVFITILASEDPDDDDDDGDGDSDDEDSDDEDSDDEDSDDNDSDDKAAALPDTGAADNLNLIGSFGIGLTILGMFMVVATPRRRAATHRA
jgi:hypothetical protein